MAESSRKLASGASAPEIILKDVTSSFVFHFRRNAEADQKG